MHRLILLTAIALGAACSFAADKNDPDVQSYLTDIIAESGKALGGSFATIATAYTDYYAYSEVYATMEIIGELALSDGKDEVLNACRALLADPDRNTRAAAILYLNQFEGTAAAESHIVQLYKESTPDDVYLLTIFSYPLTVATADGGGEPAPDSALLAAVEADLKSDDPQVRLRGAHFLGYMPNEQTLPLFRQTLKSPDAEVRRFATSCLPRYYVGSDSAVFVASNLEAALQDEDMGVRRAAAAGLTQTGEPGPLAGLLAALKDPDVKTRRLLAQAILNAARASSQPDARTGKEIKKALKAETDPIARCNLANAYAYTQPISAGSYRQLKPSGYWAFFSGNWKEKEMDSYFQELAGGG